MGKNDDWRIDWMKGLGCELSYKIADNEVWKNHSKVIVWHPEIGLRTMFHTCNMSEKCQKEIIEKVLLEQQEKINKKILIIP